MEAEYIDLSYAAGFIEADGCFHITNSSIAIRVTNKNFKVLNWFKNIYEGVIHKKSKPKDCFEWNLYGKQAFILCNNLLPYLKFKNKEAEILIEFYKTINVRGKKVNTTIEEKRNNLRLRLKEQRLCR